MRYSRDAVFSYDSTKYWQISLSSFSDRLDKSYMDSSEIDDDCNVVYVDWRRREASKSSLTSAGDGTSGFVALILFDRLSHVGKQSLRILLTNSGMGRSLNCVLSGIEANGYSFNQSVVLNS